MKKKIKDCSFDCLPELVSGSIHSGMTRWIDISWPVSPQMTTYKNRGGVVFTPTKEFLRDGARETSMSLTSHTGTHVDAPAHFIQTGSTVDKLPFSSLVGPCLVLDLSHVQTCITKQDLQDCPIPDRAIILLKTRNSLRAPTDVFAPDFVYLSEDGAQFLVEKNVLTVGIDGLGIERGQPEHQTHTQLLMHGITIIEGLRLAQACHGTYFLCCLPLLLEGLDGAPARAILCTYEG